MKCLNYLTSCYKLPTSHVRRKVVIWFSFFTQPCLHHIKLYRLTAHHSFLPLGISSFSIGSTRALFIPWKAINDFVIFW